TPQRPPHIDGVPIAALDDQGSGKYRSLAQPNAPGHFGPAAEGSVAHTGRHRPGRRSCGRRADQSLDEGSVKWQSFSFVRTRWNERERPDSQGRACALDEELDSGFAGISRKARQHGDDQSEPSALVTRVDDEATQLSALLERHRRRGQNDVTEW